MKNLLIIACLFVSTIGSSQEWGTVQKNKVTMKEIAPVWPGCESKKGSATDNCFRQNLARHIGKNFKYPAEAYKKNEQGRVVVTFDINEKGLVDIKSITGAGKLLQAEARRNIMLIPKMSKPGMMAGKPRKIEYIVPITFKTGK